MNKYYGFLSEPLEACVPPICKIPLSMGARTFSPLLIKQGEVVKEGQIIAKSNDTPCHYLHAPIPGTVQGIETVERPGGLQTEAVIIHLSGEFSWQRSKLGAASWQHLTAARLFQHLHERGPTAFLASTLPDPTKNKHRQVVITACPYEPSLMSDGILLQNYMDEVICGVEIIEQMYHASEVIFAISRDAQLSLEKKIKGKKLPWKVAYIQQDSSVYFLNNDVVVQKIRAGHSTLKDPIVLPVNFVYAAYEAIALSRPLMDRIIAVGGSSMKNPRFVRARLGTSVGEIFRECGGWKSPPQRIVAGGLLTGKTIVDLSTPVSGDMLGIFALTEQEILLEKEMPCIQCGSCVRTCPVNLHPLLLYKLIRKKDMAGAEGAGLNYCLECGLCAQVCPSRLPLSSIIGTAKRSGESVIT